MFNLFKRQGHTNLEWMNTDVHSHLLPGIDDGVPNASSGVHLIKLLMDLGLRQFIITPHVYDEVYPNTPETIDMAHEKLYMEMERSGLEDVYTHSGGEYMLGERFGNLLENNRVRAFPTGHLLVELPWLAEPPQLEQTLFRILSKGYIPIMAHPERYTFYSQQYKMYHRLKDIGCLLQMNLLAPTGYYGREVSKSAEYLRKNNMYDFVGTDLHNERQFGRLAKYVKSGNAYKDLKHLNLKNKIFL